MFEGFAQSTFEKLAEKFSSMETGPGIIIILYDVTLKKHVL